MKITSLNIKLRFNLKTTTVQSEDYYLSSNKKKQYTVQRCHSKILQKFLEIHRNSILCELNRIE